MDNLRKLEEIFSHFPGIGPRQAKRFVYYLLNRPQANISEFTRLIEEVRKSVNECVKCHRFFIANVNGSKSSACNICADTSRDRHTLMVVARDSDFDAIEKSGAYHALYFILGGTVPVLDREPEKRIRLEQLLHYISSMPALDEVILSMSTTPDGEHTAHIVREAIEKFRGQTSEGRPREIRVTILGRGLSTGAELEYADGETIKGALENRK